MRDTTWWDLPVTVLMIILTPSLRMCIILADSIPFMKTTVLKTRRPLHITWRTCQVILKTIWAWCISWPGSLSLTLSYRTLNFMQTCFRICWEYLLSVLTICTYWPRPGIHPPISTWRIGFSVKRLFMHSYRRPTEL